MIERSVAGFGRPRGPGEARGFLPAVLAALSVGKAIWGAVEANQVKQRNKGYINDAYRTAQAQQRIHEGDVRQGGAESLAARGLLSPDVAGGSQSRIAAAMKGPGTIAASSTLGGRDAAETDAQLGLQRHGLDAAHQQALNENNATALNSEIGSIESGVGGLAQAYGASQELGAMGGGGAPASAPVGVSPDQLPGVQSMSSVGTDIGSPSVSPIGAAMGASSTHWGGIDAVDPLGASGSNWNTSKQTLSGVGSPNSDFHV